MAVDGIVGNATWYKLVYLYVGVNQLNDLQSQGQTFYALNWQPPETTLTVGSTGEKVGQLQHMLAVGAFFITSVPTVALTGVYGEDTRQSVEAFQQYSGMEQTGEVDTATWNAIYNTYMGIDQTVFANMPLFPFDNEPAPALPLPSCRASSKPFPPCILACRSPPAAVSTTGAPRCVLPIPVCLGLPRSGKVDPALKTALVKTISNSRYSTTTRFTQFPGFDIIFGMQDPASGGERCSV